MSGAIFLGGGGSEHDERLLWDEIFEPGQRVVVWPFAQRDRVDRQRAGQWLLQTLSTRGVFGVDTWLDESRHLHELRGADALVILGGNTFDLLAFLQQHDWLPAVGRFLDQGGRVYGGSAGAILMGADIAVAGAMDPNDAGINDTRGLDLLAGCVVYPHYDPDHEQAAAEWARRHRVTVIGIPEDAGVVVHGTTARNVGPGAIHIFSDGKHHTQPARAAWTLI